MKNLLLKEIIAGTLLGIVGGVLGVIVGAMYGGNFDTGFRFAGVNGYEAWGIIIGTVGMGLGTALGVLWMQKKAGLLTPIQRGRIFVGAALGICLALLYSVFQFSTPRPGSVIILLTTIGAAHISNMRASMKMSNQQRNNDKNTRTQDVHQ